MGLGLANFGHFYSRWSAIHKFGCMAQATYPVSVSFLEIIPIICYAPILVILADDAEELSSDVYVIVYAGYSNGSVGAMG